MITRMKGGAFAPSHEWIAALQEQATVALLVRVQRYARAQARACSEVETAAGEVEQLTIKLVIDCVTRTLAGAAAWDPVSSSLEMHWIESLGAQAAEVRAGLRGEASPLVGSDTDAEDTEELGPARPARPAQPVRPGRVDAEVARFAERQQLSQHNASKMLQALRVVLPSDDEILALLHYVQIEAQIHHAAMAEIAGEPTADEARAVRGLAQYLQDNVAQLRDAGTSRGRR